VITEVQDAIRFESDGRPLCLYLVILGGFLALMYQPPTRFARVAAHLPEPLFGILLLEPLWLFARSGRLEVGKMAPDFRLPALDKTSYVQLSSFRGDKPVVLVFGSYT